MLNSIKLCWLIKEFNKCSPPFEVIQFEVKFKETKELFFLIAFDNKIAPLFPILFFDKFNTAILSSFIIIEHKNLIE